MTATLYTKPLPEISEENRPFWDGLKRGEFSAPRCTECGDFGWIPYPACRTCLSTELEWIPLSGLATIFSYSIVYRGPGAFADDVPYILVLAELLEQPRPMLVLAQLTDCPLDEVRIGLPVQVAFTDIPGEDVTLYSFIPDVDPAQRIASRTDERLREERPMSPDPGEAQDFRSTARSWLAANVPTDSRPADDQALIDYDVAWQRRQFEAGWAGIDWPVQFGGRGLSAMEQVIWYEELVQAGAPHKSVLTAGLHQIGQTLMLCGSTAQKEQYLPGILDGSVIWCQGFSEPDAGSDLASLRTSATVTDDELVINGSKVWCSFGPFARMQGALVRTDPHQPRHRGLSWVIVDLQTPGVTVRPIETIDGNAEFAEVFYDDVRVPRENVVGELNQGWQVALSTLALERGPAFLDTKLAMLTELDALADMASSKELFADKGLAREFAEVRAGAAAIRAMAYRLVSPGQSGGVTAAAGTSFSVHSNELRQRLSRLALQMVGAGAEEVPWTKHWLNDFCATIAGGTSDIQRNVIGERVLGLPR